MSGANPRRLDRSASYGFDGLVVRVEAPPPCLDWLDEFLLPWLGTHGSSRIDYQLRLLEDDARYAALIERRGQSCAAPIVGFVRDGAPAMLLPLRDGSERPWWFDRELQAFYSIDGASIDIAITRGNRDAGFALARVFRELVMEHTFAVGVPVLHAAAVGRDGRAALVLGDRGAGKTTFKCLLPGAARIRLHCQRPGRGTNR